VCYVGFGARSMARRKEWMSVFLESIEVMKEEKLVLVFPLRRPQFRGRKPALKILRNRTPGGGREKPGETA